MRKSSLLTDTQFLLYTFDSSAAKTNETKAKRRANTNELKTLLFASLTPNVVVCTMCYAVLCSVCGAVLYMLSLTNTICGVRTYVTLTSMCDIGSVAVCELCVLLWNIWQKKSEARDKASGGIGRTSENQIYLTRIQLCERLNVTLCRRQSER